MMTAAILHDMIEADRRWLTEAEDVAALVALPHDERRASSTRVHLARLRVALRHEHYDTERARDVAGYWHARRTFWREYYTTDDASAADDRDAIAAIARGCGGAHVPWAQED